MINHRLVVMVPSLSLYSNHNNFLLLFFLLLLLPLIFLFFDPVFAQITTTTATSDFPEIKFEHEKYALADKIIVSVTDPDASKHVDVTIVVYNRTYDIRALEQDHDSPGVFTYSFYPSAFLIDKEKSVVMGTYAFQDENSKIHTVTANTTVFDVNFDPVKKEQEINHNLTLNVTSAAADNSTSSILAPPLRSGDTLVIQAQGQGQLILKVLHLIRGLEALHHGTNEINTTYKLDQSGIYQVVLSRLNHNEESDIIIKDLFVISSLSSIGSNSTTNSSNVISQHNNNTRLYNGVTLDEAIAIQYFSNVTSGDDLNNSTSSNKTGLIDATITSGDDLIHLPSATSNNNKTDLMNANNNLTDSSNNNKTDLIETRTSPPPPPSPTLITISPPDQNKNTESTTTESTLVNNTTTESTLVNNTTTESTLVNNTTTTESTLANTTVDTANIGSTLINNNTTESTLINNNNTTASTDLNKNTRTVSFDSDSFYAAIVIIIIFAIILFVIILLKFRTRNINKKKSNQNDAGDIPSVLGEPNIKESLKDEKQKEEKEKQEREQKEQREKQEREQKEQKEKQEKEQREKQEKEQKEREKQEKEQKEREKQEKEQKEREKQEKEQREKQEREQKEKQQKEKQQKEQKQKQESKIQSLKQIIDSALAIFDPLAKKKFEKLLSCLFEKKHNVISLDDAIPTPLSKHLIENTEQLLKSLSDLEESAYRDQEVIGTEQQQPTYLIATQYNQFLNKLEYLKFRLYHSKIPVIGYDFRDIPAADGGYYDNNNNATILPGTNEFIQKYGTLIAQSKSLLSKMPDFASLDPSNLLEDIIQNHRIIIIPDPKLSLNLAQIEKINQILIVLFSDCCDD